MGGQDIGVLYILTNPAMPGLVKIGFTTTMDPDARAAELSAATGVPLPFQTGFVFAVEKPREVEQRVHAALSEHRLAANREFFRLSEVAAWDGVAKVLWPIEYMPDKRLDFDFLLFLDIWVRHHKRMTDRYPTICKWGFRNGDHEDSFIDLMAQVSRQIQRRSDEPP